MAAAVLQYVHNGIGAVSPYLAEGPLSDIAQGVVLPELVGMNVPDVVYICK